MKNVAASHKKGVENLNLQIYKNRKSMKKGCRKTWRKRRNGQTVSSKAVFCKDELLVIS